MIPGLDARVDDLISRGPAISPVRVTCPALRRWDPPLRCQWTTYAPLGRVRVPPVGGVATILFSRPYWRIDPTFIGILTGPTQARGTMKGTTTNVTGGTMEGMIDVLQS